MKKAWIVGSALLFVSFAGFAQTPGQIPLTSAALAAIFGEPAVTGSCAGRQGGATFAASSLKSACTATAQCVSGAFVQCSGNSNCTAVDGNCSIGEPGHVTCDGQTTTCANCCVGTLRDRACCRCSETGSCIDCCRCDGGTIAQCGLACG
jgi:hypothetical protein